MEEELSELNNFIENLFKQKEIFLLIDLINKEMANRNYFPLKDFMDNLDPEIKDELNINCIKLLDIIRNIISSEDTFTKIISIEEKPLFISMALFFGEDREKKQYNLEKVSEHICIGLLTENNKNMDYYIENLLNNSLVKKLNIKTDKDLLVNLSDKRLDLKKHGIIFNNSVLIYPHQFLRRHYTSNFVDINCLLNNALDSEIQVSIRIDPLRETDKKYYREIFECDYWYGPRFSKNILMDKNLTNRTIHYSNNEHNIGYRVDFTIFRTKIMDDDIREFMIEEYCPIDSYTSNILKKSKLYIQKFAHIAYDQKKECFVHLDGAVRVFNKNDYIEYYKIIKNGGDVDEKIGDRYKMFLLEGNINDDLTQKILTSWFMYNPHIGEYFSNKT